MNRGGRTGAILGGRGEEERSRNISKEGGRNGLLPRESMEEGCSSQDTNK